MLKGSFVFLADLLRELTISAEVDFVRARSYGAGTRSAGAVEITKDLETDVTGRDVIVVEDIADTGRTMRTICARIAAGRPASLRRCALLVREDARNFSFPVGRLEDAPVDIDEASRESKGIDARIVDESELIGVRLERSDRCELLSQAIDVFAQEGVADEIEFLLGFACNPAAHLNIFVGREYVETRFEFGALCPPGRNR